MDGLVFVVNLICSKVDVWNRGKMTATESIFPPERAAYGRLFHAPCDRMLRRGHSASRLSFGRTVGAKNEEAITRKNIWRIASRVCLLLGLYGIFGGIILSTGDWAMPELSIVWYTGGGISLYLSIWFLVLSNLSPKKPTTPSDENLN
jgi:hypothetical protein